MVKAGVSDQNPVSRFNRESRDHLANLRGKIDRNHSYTDFPTRKRMDKLRGSWALRQQGANDRYKLHTRIQERTRQSALKNEWVHIESHKSYMNLPMHMQQRLGELEAQLA